MFVFFYSLGKWQEMENKSWLICKLDVLIRAGFCQDISRSTEGFVVVCQYYMNAFGCFTEPVATSSWK